MDDIPVVEDLIQVNIFLYDIDTVDGSSVGELALIVVQLVTSFSAKLETWERHLVICKDRIKHVYPRNVYKLRETLFDKLDFFSIPNTKEQQLFKNLTVFDFDRQFL